MSDWAQLFEEQFVHDASHFQQPDASVDLYQTWNPDPSCVLCFPDNFSPDPTWQRFCQWFFRWYSVSYYTGYTRQYWKLLRDSTLPVTDPFYSNTFRQLLLTFRYHQIPSPVEQIVQACCNTFVRTRRFARTFPETEVDRESDRTREPLSFSSDSNQPTDASVSDFSETETLQPEDETDSKYQYLEDLRRLFTSPPPVVVPPVVPVVPGTMDNNADAILEALQKLGARRPTLHIKPFRGYSQDPGSWIRDYEQAAHAVGWDTDTMLDAVPAYLRDAAHHWFLGLADGQIARWAPTDGHPERNRAFKTALMDEFRTPMQERAWQTELDQRTQRKDETVEQYAAAVRSLMRKVDPQNNVPEGIRIQWFLRGLQPSLQYQVQNYLACRDEVTLNGIVAAACQYEQGQNAHMQALSRGTEPKATTPNVVATATVESPLEELVKQMTQLLQPMATAITQMQQQMAANTRQPVPAPRQQYPSPTPANQPARQWQPRQPRGTLTCHRCGQYGHIARVCPNPLASQAPVQPAAAAPAQPTVTMPAPPTALRATTALHTQMQAPPPMFSPPVQPAPTTKQVRFASPAQIPQPDSSNYCSTSDQDMQSLNF